jgi:5-formyltetrahydrofolate cyclo-ligase
MNLQSKKELRKLLKEKRNKLQEDVLRNKSFELEKILINSSEYKKAKTIFCYISFGKEIDTYYILEQSFLNNKNVCVPFMINKEIIACEITSLDNLKENKLGILEPVNIVEIPKETIDLIIVPALGFDKNGFRIGYGGGFYDKYLQDYKGFSAGMILNEFVIDNFIPDEYDKAVNKVFIL